VLSTSTTRGRWQGSAARVCWTLKEGYGGGCVEEQAVLEDGQGVSGCTGRTDSVGDGQAGVDVGTWI
jgi:hypothetical protein